MKYNTVLIILNILGILGSLIWLMVEKSWEPLVASIGLIGGLIALLKNKEEKSSTLMNQRGGKKSTNYQSSGDININDKNDQR